VITNERQYRITKAQLKKFEQAATSQAQRSPAESVDPRIHKAMGDALQSEVAELRRQLDDYERLRSGRIRSRSVNSLSAVPTAIIEARIAGHVTQKALADRLGIAEQQVQRWEATNYSGVSIERIQDVADALGVRIKETVQFKPPPRSRKGGRSAARTKPRVTTGKREKGPAKARSSSR
jgi:transcriptional regulator with XRE-family HTH domain